MDKELKLIQKVQEKFPKEIISTLEVMEKDKQLWRAMELFESLRLRGEHGKVEKVGKWIEWTFGVDLQAN